MRFGWEEEEEEEMLPGRGSTGKRPHTICFFLSSDWFLFLLVLLGGSGTEAPPAKETGAQCACYLAKFNKGLSTASFRKQFNYTPNGLFLFPSTASSFWKYRNWVWLPMSSKKYITISFKFLFKYLRHVCLH